MKLSDLDERGVDPTQLANRVARRYGKEKDYGYDHSDTNPGGYIPLQNYNDDDADELEAVLFAVYRAVAAHFNIDKSKATEYVRSRRYNKTISISMLHPLQPFVRTNDQDVLKNKISDTNPSHISLARLDTKYFIIDGHHAIMAAAMRGEKTITAPVIDLNELRLEFLKESVNESNEEHYTLELDNNNTVLILKSSKSKSWVEVRGKQGYETHGYDPKDPLHRILDALDPATVSNLFAGIPITLNPKNPRSDKSIKAVKKIMATEGRLYEDGRIVKGVNTTIDVGVDEIPRQAIKYGNQVDIDGFPPTISTNGEEAKQNKIKEDVSIKQRLFDWAKY